MNLFNKFPTLAKIALFQRNVGRGCLRKELAVSTKCGSMFYSKFVVNSDVDKNVEPTGKVLNVAIENNDKIHNFNKKFIIEDLKKEDVQEAKVLLSKNYSSLNPLCSMLHISYQDQMEMLDESVHQLVGNKLSIVARDRRTMKIVGTCFPRIHSRPDKAAINVPSSNSYDKNIKIKNCYHIINILRNSVNLYEKYNIDKIVEPSLAAIDQKFSGNGLLKSISQEVLKRAKELEYRVLIGVPTHAVTQAHCKSLGGILEFEIDVESIEIDGKQVLDLERKSGISSFKLFSIHL